MKENIYSSFCPNHSSVAAKRSKLYMIVIKTSFLKYIDLIKHKKIDYLKMMIRYHNHNFNIAVLKGIPNKSMHSDHKNMSKSRLVQQQGFEKRAESYKIYINEAETTIFLSSTNTENLQIEKRYINLRQLITSANIDTNSEEYMKNKTDSAKRVFHIWENSYNKIIKIVLKTIRNYRNRKTKVKNYCFKASISEQIINGLEINHHICTIVDQNDALFSNYAHFHVLLHLSNSQILSCYDGNNDLLLTVNRFIIHHLQRPYIRKQLTELDYYTAMSFLVGIRKKSRTQILDFMRSFIHSNKEVLMGICPYYYNLFSFVANKPIIFQNKQPNRQHLHQYTVQYSHHRYYEGQFTRADIIRELRQLQQLLIRKYHSGEQ